MTLSIPDSEYMREVTFCLSQALVQVIELQPRDPIEFIAHSLRNYRKCHPRTACRESNEQTPGIEQAPSTSDASGNRSQTPSEPPQEMNTYSDVTGPQDLTKSCQIIEKNESNDSDENMINNSYAMVDFVHQNCATSVNGVLGDVFDDDDFG